MAPAQELTLPYFPGCTLSTKARAMDVSARAAAAALGIKLVELDDWTCCGATFPLAKDSHIALSGPARILASAGDGPARLVTLCSFCYNTLKRTNHALATDKERRDKVNTFIEEDYQCDTRVVHLLEVLRDETGFKALAERVNGRLKGLKVAPYYGCLLLRPAEELQFDDPERPTILEDFLSSLGCDPVDFPHRTECCGGFLTVSSPEVTAQASRRVVESAAKHGADLLTTTCPLCFYNLDRCQQDWEAHSALPRVPVVYFSQLLALALGEEGCLDSDTCCVDPRPVLARWLEPAEANAGS